MDLSCLDVERRDDFVRKLQKAFPDATITQPNGDVVLSLSKEVLTWKIPDLEEILRTIDIFLGVTYPNCVYYAGSIDAGDGGRLVRFYIRKKKQQPLNDHVE